MQVDYENINTGSEYMLEFRYSNMLTVLAITFLYSGGMPILYPVAASYFLITYWMDKWLLLRFYRKPVKFDNYLAKMTLGWFKYILTLHIIGVLLMFGHTDILKNDLFGQQSSSSIDFKDSQSQFTIYSAYLWAIFLLLTGYLVWTLAVKRIMKIIACCCCSRVTKKVLSRLTLSNDDLDFYKCISFESLKEKRAKNEEVLQQARMLKLED